MPPPLTSNPYPNFASMRPTAARSRRPTNPNTLPKIIVRFASLEHFIFWMLRAR
jgi:hypothetical protein